MKNKDHIHQEVEKTMQSLDGLNRAETDPFFYSRLTSKLEHRKQEQLQVQPARNLAFVFSSAVLVLLISFNLMFISSNQQQTQVDTTATEQQQWMDELTYDYQAFNLDYYTELE